MRSKQSGVGKRIVESSNTVLQSKLENKSLKGSMSPSRHNTSRPTRVLSIASGKGGVGKTVTTINLATALIERGNSVLILDGDLGLANVDLLLGIKPTATLADFFENKVSLQDVIVTTQDGIDVIPAASGIESMSIMPLEHRVKLQQAVDAIGRHYDYIILDTQAGIGPEVIHFTTASGEIILVVNNEPTSLTDAYALMKVLALNHHERRFQIVVNKAASEQDGKATFTRFVRAATKFLDVSISYLGSIVQDRAVNDSVSAQRPVVSEYPSSAAARGFRALAIEIERTWYDRGVKGGMQFLFADLLEAKNTGGSPTARSSVNEGETDDAVLGTGDYR